MADINKYLNKRHLTTELSLQSGQFTVWKSCGSINANNYNYFRGTIRLKSLWLYQKGYSGTGVTYEFCEIFKKTVLQNNSGQLLLWSISRATLTAQKIHKHILKTHTFYTSTLKFLIEQIHTFHSRNIAKYKQKGIANISQYLIITKKPWVICISDVLLQPPFSVLLIFLKDPIFGNQFK